MIEITNEQIDALLVHHGKDDDGFRGFARAVIEAHEAQRQTQPYLDGVEVDRLRAACTWIGIATPPSQEIMATDVAVYVNHLTRSLMNEKAAVEKPRQPKTNPGKMASSTFSVAVAARKWDSLQLDGYKMQRICFERNDIFGSIDSWGRVLWQDCVQETVSPENNPDALAMLTPNEPGWTFSHPHYGVWFISRAAVVADWKSDQSQAYPDEPVTEPCDDIIETWPNEQTSWIEINANGVQLQRPDMSIHESGFLQSMSCDTDMPHSNI